jgi:hypothetical protein
VKPAEYRARETEADFMQRVRDLARACGWVSFHTLGAGARGMEPGWPDLTIMRPPRIIFRELKAEKGTLSLAQKSVLDGLERCCLDVGVWRPSDWPEIEATLKAPARLRGQAA